jgi:GTP-binding protein
MFLDEAIIDVRGGSGGKGCLAWRREKYVAKGGPSGGDGGLGGHVVLMANSNTDTLSDFASRKRFEAEAGTNGGGQNRGGKDGEDLVLSVPPGTAVIDMTDGANAVLADLQHHGDTLVVARGGRGGYGNAHFATSTRQRPDFAELGEPGEHLKIKLELKLVADVGIIGYPSVGKSTLISVISSAKPKIAAYHFTTLIPNLGVVHVGDRGYVVADVPGLIEGASEGKGLGDKFLKHIERCGVLLHVLDLERALREGNEIDVGQLVADYRAIRKELNAYSPTLEKKRELVILNKSDLLAGDTAAIEQTLKSEGIDVFASISAASKQGTDKLTKQLLPIVLEERAKRAAVQEEEESGAPVLPVIKPHLESSRMGAYRIEKTDAGVLVVRGKRLEQFTVMTNFENGGAVNRFRDVAERTGLLRAIKRARKDQPDMPVYIGKVRVDEYL